MNSTENMSGFNQRQIDASFQMFSLGLMVTESDWRHFHAGQVAPLDKKRFENLVFSLSQVFRASPDFVHFERIVTQLLKNIANKQPLSEGLENFRSTNARFNTILLELTGYQS